MSLKSPKTNWLHQIVQTAYAHIFLPSNRYVDYVDGTATAIIRNTLIILLDNYGDFLTTLAFIDYLAVAHSRHFCLISVVDCCSAPVIFVKCYYQVLRQALRTMM